jgi:signal transduction histidine kinase
VRRRVLQAAVSSVLLAVLLLGVPLAVAGALLVRDQAVRSAQDRADTLARSIERRLDVSEEITPEVLRPYTNAEREWPAHVVVQIPASVSGTGDGLVVEAGEPAGDDPYTGRATPSQPSGAGGVQVLVEVPRQQVVAAVARIVLLVAVVAAVAVAAAVALALVQARRLSEPLVELARTAERLGAGQLRRRTPHSGIEEVDLVGEELRRSADRIAARLAAEREFASDASHQLRTPLTAVSMRLEEIVAASTSDAVSEEARIALGQVERLVSVVDDLLARTRARPAAATVPVPVADVLEQQRQEWEPAYAQAGRRVVVDAPADVTAAASPGPLAQALATLIENSLVHGAGTTSVSARPAGASVVVEVCDEGPGVPEELAPRVFERRVSGARSTGLGLALARDLITAEGGRLELARRSPPVFALFLKSG